VLRLLRMLWPLVFFLPLGVFAGKFCWINIVDPAYHSMLWIHERLPLLLVTMAFISIVAATIRFNRLQTSLSILSSFDAPLPETVNQTFQSEAAKLSAQADVQYMDVSRRFCFTTFNGPTIILSRGFVESLSLEELTLVARHELLHVARKDPWRSLAWHLFFAGLILPGFDAIEQLLYLQRERQVDRKVSAADEKQYSELLRRCSPRRDQAYGSICTSGIGPSVRAREMDHTSREYIWERALPAMVATGLLVLVVVSHAFFTASLPYLQTHHC